MNKNGFEMWDFYFSLCGPKIPKIIRIIGIIWKNGKGTPLDNTDFFFIFSSISGGFFENGCFFW